MDKGLPSISGVLDLLLDAVCLVDEQGHFVFVSAACESIFGYTPSEMIGRRMIDLVHPEDGERTLQAASQIMAGQALLHFENRYLRKDGQVVHIMWSARWSETDRLRIAVARDITLRKRAEVLQAATYSISEAAQSEESLSGLLEHIHQTLKSLLPCPNLLIVLRDLKTGQLTFPYRVEADHPNFDGPTQSLDAFSQEVIQSDEALLLSRSAVDENALCWLGAPLRSMRGTIGALVLRSGSGATAYTERDRELMQYVCTQIATAVERKQIFARMQYMAQYDELTDLPNRGLLQDRLKTAIARARRDQYQFSVLYLDLDKFKKINDTLGHSMGDSLLHAFAGRLKQLVRDSDTVARVGGDEFVVVLESLQQPNDNLLVIQKIRGAFNDPFALGAHTIHVRPSIGVAHYPENGTQTDVLLDFADAAMYLAKVGNQQAKKEL